MHGIYREKNYAIGTTTWRGLGFLLSSKLTRRAFLVCTGEAAVSLRSWYDGWNVFGDWCGCGWNGFAGD
jgi:hypothetical protein